LELKAAIQEKRPGMKKKMLFHHDNTPANLSAIVQQKLTKLKFEILPYPSVFVWFDSFGLSLVSKKHSWMRLGRDFSSGKRFRLNEKLIEAVNGYFENLEESHFWERN